MCGLNWQLRRHVAVKTVFPKKTFHKFQLHEFQENNGWVIPFHLKPPRTVAWPMPLFMKKLYDACISAGRSPAKKICYILNCSPTRGCKAPLLCSKHSFVLVPPVNEWFGIFVIFQQKCVKEHQLVLFCEFQGNFTAAFLLATSPFALLTTYSLTWNKNFCWFCI